MLKNLTRGIGTLETFIAVAALISSVAAPILWVGDIKETNAVQDVRIERVEKTNDEVRQDIKEINNKINALLIKNGINPDTLKQVPVSYYE